MIRLILVVVIRFIGSRPVEKFVDLHPLPSSARPPPVPNPANPPKSSLNHTKSPSQTTDPEQPHLELHFDGLFSTDGGLSVLGGCSTLPATRLRSNTDSTSSRCVSPPQSPFPSPTPAATPAPAATPTKAATCELADPATAASGCVSCWASSPPLGSRSSTAAGAPLLLSKEAGGSSVVCPHVAVLPNPSLPSPCVAGPQVGRPTTVGDRGASAPPAAASGSSGVPSVMGSPVCDGHAARSSSMSSPLAQPFSPHELPGGRSKARRWAEDDVPGSSHGEQELPPTISYLDVARRGLQQSTASPVAIGAQPTIVVGGMRRGADGADAMRGRHGRKPRRPRPRLIHGLPVRGRDGYSGSSRGSHGFAQRWPVHLRLGPQPACGARQRISTPDADGWRKVMSRGWSQGREEALLSCSVPRFPPELDGKCLNCLSSSHKVATCRLPQRCLRCKGFRHRARDCKLLRAAGSARTVAPAESASRPRRTDQGRSTPPPPRTQGDTPSPVAAVSNTAGHGGGKRRRRRHRQRLSGDATRACEGHGELTSVVRHPRGLPELDPLLLLPYPVAAVVTRQVSADPMLVEVASYLAAPSRCNQTTSMLVAYPAQLATDPPSLLEHSRSQASRPRAAHDGSTEPVLACAGGLGSLVATTEPTTLLSDMSGTTGFTEAQFEHHDLDIEASITDHRGPGVDLDADLDKFVQEIEMPISTPLPSRPIRHQPMAPPASPIPLHSSSRLANNGLSKVLVARRGEVLLMRRLIILEGTSSTSTEGRHKLDTIFNGGLSCAHAQAINDFVAAKK